MTASQITFEVAILAFGISQAGWGQRLVMSKAPVPVLLSGEVISPSPAVQLVDSEGKPDKKSGIPVVASTTGDIRLLGTFQSVTDSLGVAAFNDLILAGKRGVARLRFSAPGYEDAQTDELRVIPGKAIRLTINVQPASTARFGESFDQAPIIQLEDASGNVVEREGVTITVRLLSILQGTLKGTQSVKTSVDGTASFDDISLEGPSGTYALVFNSDGLRSVKSGSVNLMGDPKGADPRFSVFTGAEYSSTDENFSTARLAAMARYALPLRQSNRALLELVTNVELSSGIESVFNSTCSLDTVVVSATRPRPGSSVHCSTDLAVVGSRVDTLGGRPVRFDTVTRFIEHFDSVSYAIGKSWRGRLELRFLGKMSSPETGSGVYFGGVVALGLNTFAGHQVNLAQSATIGPALSYRDGGDVERLFIDLRIGWAEDYFAESVSGDTVPDVRRPALVLKNSRMHFDLLASPIPNLYLRAFVQVGHGPDLGQLAILLRVPIASIVQIGGARRQAQRTM